MIKSRCKDRDNFQPNKKKYENFQLKWKPYLIE